MFKDAQWLIDGIFETVYCFHMPFFFMLSGFTYFLAYFSREGKPRYEKIKVQMLNLLVIYLLFSETYDLGEADCRVLVSVCAVFPVSSVPYSEND